MGGTYCQLHVIVIVAHIFCTVVNICPVRPKYDSAYGTDEGISLVVTKGFAHQGTHAIIFRRIYSIIGALNGYLSRPRDAIW